VPVGPVRRDIVDVRYDEWPLWIAWAQAGMAVLFAVIAATDPAVPHRGWLAVAVLVATSTWLARPLRWNLPPVVEAVLMIGVIGFVNSEADPFGFFTPEGHEQLTFLPLVFFVGEVFSHWSLRSAIVVAAAAAVSASSFVTAHDEVAGVWLGAIGGAAVVGLLIRALLSTILDLEEAQAELAARATAEERHRIAREVHDVIAHSLTVTMLHLTAARLAVARGDDRAATEALEEAEAAGRRSLADVRRTVGLLRAEDQTDLLGTAAPTRLAGDVVELVDGYRSAGVDVVLRIDGDIAEATPEVGIAVYRTVQESLANAARHRPGARSVVELEVGALTRVRVRTDGGRPVDQPGAGAGLLGMRERADALGGRCEAGPVGDGWLVDVELPGPTVGTEVVR
jgi:signal transduction histidine kinase